MACGEVRDVSDWEVEASEPRGIRQKDWVRNPDDGTLWLRKRPNLGAKGRRCAEAAIEVATLQLATSLGLRTAEAALAQWQQDGREFGGIVVKHFCEGETLVEGMEILSGFHREELPEAGEEYDPELGVPFDEYQPSAYEQHSLERIRAALERYEEGGDQVFQLKADFCRMVAFDAWIGNGDRHQQNWGVILDAEGSPRLAPLYDTAASLGVELTDGHHLLSDRRRRESVSKANPHTRLEHYLRQCPSGFGDGRKQILHDLVLREIRDWPEWGDATSSLIDSFDAACHTAVVEIVHAFSASHFPSDRKELAVAILTARLKHLKEFR